MASTGRYPFIVEAFEAGYLPGNREDSSYQLSEEHRNVDLVQGFMDNDYEDPDLDEFLETFYEREPSVAVVGDAYTREEAERYQDTIYSLKEEYPNRRFIVAPKCEEAFDVLDPSTTTLGYANGKSEIQAEDLGSARFRGWDVHILGSNPVEAYEDIQDLTQPTLDNREPANVVGYDTNLPLRMAYWEYWTPEGWQSNGHLSPRESARRSYQEIKSYLQDKGVWPETEPVELYGPPVMNPDDDLFLNSGRPIRSREELEKAVVEEYDDRTYAFESDAARKFLEYREGLIG